MIFKNCDAKIPTIANHAKPLFEPHAEEIFTAMKNFSFDKALAAIIEFATIANRNFNDAAPWNLKKENKISEMHAALAEAAESIRLIAISLLPFVPESAKKILDLLNVEESQRNFISLNNSLLAGHKINEPKAVFPRLEAK
jgi:methionyl-tRNA synthetase